jgi:hypothetical protein
MWFYVLRTSPGTTTISFSSTIFLEDSDTDDHNRCDLFVPRLLRVDTQIPYSDAWHPIVSRERAHETTVRIILHRDANTATAPTAATVSAFIDDGGDIDNASPFVYTSL